MCGIWASLLSNNYICTKSYIYSPWIHRVSPRGPDRSIEVRGEGYHFAFHRLAIHDASPKGDQPFHLTAKDGTVYHVICNGEIYNYKALVQKHKIKMYSGSDCEVILHMLVKNWDNPKKVLDQLDGEYAFVAMRTKPDGTRDALAARDPFGVRPLFYASFEATGRETYFSSLLAGIPPVPGLRAEQFPPGHYIYLSLDQSQPEPTPVRFYHGLPVVPSKVDSFVLQDAQEKIASTLIEAVQKRLDSDRPVGFLLSGGLDSSLVVGIATKILGVKKPKTFSIGLRGSTDLEYARQVANYLDTEHSEITFDVSHAIRMIPELIGCLETYDITTIRASIGSFLLARFIKDNTDVRVILNGDGSDEVACGYLYNYYAPSPEEAHKDAERLLQEIHFYDGLRVDRTLSYHGLEARVPFLDPAYVEAYLSFPAEVRVPVPKLRMEKDLLRQAFLTLHPDVLPEEILLRRKEAFSDGVSAPANAAEPKQSMIEMIQGFLQAKGIEEADFYKKVFDELFPNHDHVIPHYWMPQWTTETKDPSARTLSIYHDTE